MIAVRAHVRNNRVIPNHDRNKPTKRIDLNEILSREVKINRYEDFIQKTKGVSRDLINSIVIKLDNLKKKQSKQVETYLFQDV